MDYRDGYMKGCDNLNLYYQCWLPHDEPKTILLVVHGLAEHSGRYNNLASHFVTKGYGVYVYDQRGHGKSDGLRGYVNRFSYFVDDLNIFLRLVRSKHPDAKIFLVGHSVGATIAAAYTIVHQNSINGLILTGITLSIPSDVTPITIFAARILSLLLPKAGLYVIDAEAISRDRNVIKAYVSDPLVYRGKIRARLGAELIKAMGTINGKISEIHIPILVMHGTADRLSDPKGSDLLFREASSTDKTLKVYEGYYHEIFNEPGHQQVLEDMGAWLESRI